ncbi:hypothetical protein TL16_g03561 [Triparma laevis f. inornata]|nr:hypothetical protein TL16_g03561 [Triparma laevis f. inornata]
MKTIKRKLERILGAVDPLIDAVKADLSKDGRTLGGKEKNGAKQGAPKSLLLKVIRKVVEEAIKSRSSKKEPEVKNSNGEDNGEVKEEELLTSTIEMGDCFERIHKFYIEADNKKKSKEEEAIEEESEVDEDDRDDEEDNLENKKDSPNANDEELLVFDFSKPVKKRKSSTMPSWKSLLLEILKKLGGLEKVYHTLKPSTGPFGNWGIIGACKGLNISSQDYVFDCTVVMGKKSSKQKKGYVSLHGSDTEEDIEEQWSKLRSLFLNDLSVLLSHHKNHYALIYALREYKKDGKWVRQVFTARKGQRPSCWIDFEELRKTYLGWEGYKLMVVTGKKL